MSTALSAVVTTNGCTKAAIDFLFAFWNYFKLNSGVVNAVCMEYFGNLLADVIIIIIIHGAQLITSNHYVDVGDIFIANILPAVQFMNTYNRRNSQNLFL